MAKTFEALRVPDSHVTARPSRDSQPLCLATAREAAFWFPSRIESRKGWGEKTRVGARAAAEPLRRGDARPGLRDDLKFGPAASSEVAAEVGKAGRPLRGGIVLEDPDGLGGQGWTRRAWFWRIRGLSVQMSPGETPPLPNVVGEESLVVISA